jgi:chemotaxis protein MotB
VQKRGIADYFEPTISSKSNSGAGGVLGGLTVGSPGSETVSLSKPSFEFSQSALRQPAEGDDGNEGGSAGNDLDQTDTAGAPQANDQPPKKLTDAEFEKQAAEREEKRFEDAKKALEDAVQSSPELQALAKNLLIDETPEGLRIQLVDQDKSPMFPLGSADMLDPARKLMAQVAQVIVKLPNKITITGHTDSTQYALGAKYTNWELSADRANATRREFQNDGVPTDRLTRVIGMADQDPIDKSDPSDPQNRRISIVLLRENQDNPPASTQAAAAKPAPPAPTQSASK